jgi:hypothetical protein
MVFVKVTVALLSLNKEGTVGKTFKTYLTKLVFNECRAMRQLGEHKMKISRKKIERHQFVGYY